MWRWPPRSVGLENYWRRHLLRADPLFHQKFGPSSCQNILTFPGFLPSNSLAGLAIFVPARSVAVAVL